MTSTDSVPGESTRKPFRFRFSLRFAMFFFLLAGVLLGWLGREYTVVNFASTPFAVFTTTVPEPGSMLALAGVAGAVAIRRRRR